MSSVSLSWTRDKAIDYISARTPMARAEVEIEVDRYLTWPGQACAYKIGELKIKEVRKRASDALGRSYRVSWDLRYAFEVLVRLSEMVSVLHWRHP